MLFRSDAELTELTELREKPAGTIRITADEHAAGMVLWPALEKFLPDYPDIKVEIVIDFGLTDIVAERYDAGVRNVETVAKDMIAVPIGPPMRMAVVGSPDYFSGRARPKVPQDLTSHRCINLRLPTHGGLYAWEFDKDGRELRVRVDGQLIFNSVSMMVKAALGGAGPAYVPEAAVTEHLKKKRLMRGLEDWCEPFSGYHLYYPSRRQHAPAFALLVEALRYRSSIQHVDDILAIMVPPAGARGGFYEFWGRAVEPWDGPAFLTFSDGARPWCCLTGMRCRTGPLSRACWRCEPSRTCSPPPVCRWKAWR